MVETGNTIGALGQGGTDHGNAFINARPGNPVVEIPDPALQKAAMGKRRFAPAADTARSDYFPAFVAWKAGCSGYGGDKFGIQTEPWLFRR